MSKSFRNLFIVFLIAVVPVLAQSRLFKSGYLPPVSIAATDNSLAGLVNPANLGYRTETQMMFIAPAVENDWTGGFSGFMLSPGSVISGEWIVGDTTLSQPNYQRWHVGLGMPIYKSLNLGMNFRWFGTINRKMETDLAFSFRPKSWIAGGLMIENISSKNSRDKSFIAGVALRPVRDILTLGTDVLLDNEQQMRHFADLRLMDGVHLSANYYPESEDLHLGINIDFSTTGVGLYNQPGSDELVHNSFVYHASPNRYKSVMEKPGKKIMVYRLPGLIEEEGRFRPTSSATTVREVLEHFRMFQKDPDIRGVLLECGNLSAGFSKLYEIRQGIKALKESGKIVVCYAESFTNGSYFLGSACDKVYLHKVGTAWVYGLSATSLHFKNLFDYLGIQSEIQHIGDYKSAPEQYSREDMSESARYQMQELIDDLYSVYRDEICSARELKPEVFDTLINQGPFTAPAAVKGKLVDDLIYADEISGKLESLAGGKVNIIPFKRMTYQKSWQNEWKYQNQSVNKIALIYASGGIVSGKTQPGFSNSSYIGSETMVKALRDARKDPLVKAIVLRIDSPGGSSLASDVIWREVYLATRGKNKKPVIVSMADVAASGGYYIACAADKIVALPTTITGSIGVYGGKFDASGLIDKIGITTDVVKKGDHADMMTLFRPWTEDEKDKIGQSLQWTYDEFIAKVAEGRGLSKDSVRTIAGGRVWSGTDAKSVGLVDELGGLDTALKLAGEMAGIQTETVALKILPGWWHGFIEVDMKTLFAKESTLEKMVPDNYQAASVWFNTWLYNQDENVQALMPFWPIIE